MKRLGVNYTGFLADKKKGAKSQNFKQLLKRWWHGVKEKSWTRKWSQKQEKEKRQEKISWDLGSLKMKEKEVINLVQQDSGSQG